MSQNKDISADLQAQVNNALSDNTPLNIIGGNTKNWYGNQPHGEALSTAAHQGIVNYEPTELVITARSGTPIKHIEEALESAGQQLPFEPPHFGASATLGGTIACNFSGPARPYGGAARDLVLGCKIINGKGEILSFGGEVMKNVAGYDLSRLMAGSLGTLGVLLEISLKVLPRAESEVTVVMDMNAAEGIDKMCQLDGRSLPITAACHHAERLHLRLAGTEGAVKQAQKQLAGEVLESGVDFWNRLKEHELNFFNNNNVWRISVAPDTPVMGLEGKWLYDWGGAQRWLVSTQSAAAIRSATEQVGGHATLFRTNYSSPYQNEQAFHPLGTGMMRYQRQLKAAFDPQGIFNPQRMYSEF
uniref:Glycolate dehydrogenase (EC, FAD-binding subunit GlcE) n=1 Tax=uncultured Thiotrichaceae bacterium TaxID=298394 RepID=A0A6S6TDW2_9GAMM|nr:MAG: Glycolate dehydrogenase (EC, FAD-binding subunit GlcE [uncultured Thiotrichaceae bacterium]